MLAGCPRHRGMSCREDPSLGERGTRRIVTPKKGGQTTDHFTLSTSLFSLFFLSFVSS